MPISPDRDIAKRFFYRSTPGGLPSAPARPESPHLAPCLCNTPPRPAFCQDRCPMQTRPPSLSIPSVPAVARSDPASPRTAAGSDVLPPAAASSNAHASPAVLHSSPAVAASWSGNQFSVPLGKPSRRHKFPRLYASRLSASRTWFERNRWQESRVILTACFPSLIHCSAVPRLL